ncbi:cytochrome c5 family protein [uncultured Psychromonas sp.]|uniref:c-type cytochrome n=1 Tax=uncultured Psychromonas sp. TaxID=173974 RepID=UPI00262E0848|nr:cytochrome c5 family protein [uncultured Psychromonas sp.]
MTLIKRLSLFITLSMSLFSVSSFAQDFSDEAIASRIAPISDVYIDGEIVTANTASASDEPAEPRTGEQVYGTFCIACHGTGAAGAPIKGDAAAWGPRIAQGEETLIKHALSGFNAMPAKGTCSNCSDDEIIATVKFLTEGL